MMTTNDRPPKKIAKCSPVLSIVIAEDDDANAEILKRFSERVEGVEVSGIAKSCADVRDFVDVFKPKLILLDVNFPDGNGLDLLREWRAEGRDLDVILVTAASEVNTFKDALRSGVFDYILKPLAFDRLAEALENYKQHLVKLEATGHLEQEQVDELRSTNNEDASKSSILPKGIDLVTLEKVRRLVSVETSLSAEEAGKQLGVSRSTARRYLEYLISCGQLKVDLDYGHVGRPERRYAAID